MSLILLTIWPIISRIVSNLLFSLAVFTRLLMCVGGCILIIFQKYKITLMLHLFSVDLAGRKNFSNVYGGLPSMCELYEDIKLFLFLHVANGFYKCLPKEKGFDFVKD